VTCSTCGAENRPGRKFCANCGSALAATCPSCGAANEPGDRFCGECGTALEPAAAAERVDLLASGSERRLVSVLFTDLVGFTTLSEGRDAEDVRELLSEYFESARRIVERYGGTIEKFIGDAVMAVWGSPIAREDDAERAVRAGLDLVAAVSALGTELGILSLAARAGVATGEAAVDRAAEGQGMVIGDLVNTASRVQSAAEPGQLFVTEGTKRASDAAIAYADTGVHELKGKSEPMALFRADRIVAGRGGSFRAAGLEAPFVGRDRELRLSKDLFHASAETSAAHVVAVSGSGGIGKSRLAWEFEKYLDGIAGDVYWHRGRCIPYGDGVAYWALAEMVRSRLRVAEEEDPASTRAKLRAWLAEWCPDEEERRWLESMLAQLLALSERETAPREELFSAWRRFFELLAARAATVLVFEDLQWADSGLLDFIDELLARATHQPFYLIALARPEIAERRPGWGTGRSGWTSITLGPLSDEDIRSMLRGMAPGLPEDLIERIRERSEGVPLYAVETVRMLIDRGVLRKTPEGLEVAADAPVGDLDVPETLQALIGARLDELPADQRSVLQHASILGKTFSLQALAAVTGAQEEALTRSLDMLRERELLTVVEDPASPDRGQYGFLQSIVQRVVYDTVSRRDRKARHLAVARHLEEAWAGDADDIAEVVASHYVDAYEAEPNDPDAPEIRSSAAAALERAGRRARSLASTSEAAVYYDRAAELERDDLRRTSLRERAAEAIWAGGDAAAAIDRLDPIIAEYDRLGRSHDAARARAMIGDALWSLNRLEEGLGRIEDAYVALADASGKDVAALAGQLGRLRYFSSTDEETVRESLRPIERALELAEAERIGDVLSDAMNTKALIMDSLNRPEESLALLQHALVVGLEHDATPAILRAYTNLSNTMWGLDRYEEALSYQEPGRVLAERTGYRYSWWFLTGHLAHVLHLTGRWDELEVLWTEFEARRGEPGSDACAPNFDYLRVLVEGVARGDADGAVRLAETMRKWEGSDDFQARNFIEALYSHIAILRGRPEEAVERTERVLNARAALSSRHWVFKVAVELALEASFAVPDLERADAVLVEIVSLPPGQHTPQLDAAIAGYSATLAAARAGDPGEIDAGFRKAASLCAEIGDPFRRARYLLMHAEWLATTERPGEALVAAGEAAAIFRSLRATPWLERAERLAPVALTASDASS
jgi:class 3 adenylate cyclase/tetratricopeptide (TPR) repeat protein